MARLRVRHQPPARPDAGAPAAGAVARRQPVGGGHHRRRADGPLRGRPGRVQLPADAPDDRARRCARSARCTREGITINTFMLERSRALAEFVERMTRLNRGRAFYADSRAARASTCWSTTWIAAPGAPDHPPATAGMTWTVAPSATCRAQVALALAIDEDVDVLAQLRPGITQSVAHARPARSSLSIMSPSVPASSSTRRGGGSANSVTSERGRLTVTTVSRRRPRPRPTRSTADSRRSSASCRPRRCWRKRGRRWTRSRCPACRGCRPPSPRAGPSGTRSGVAGRSRAPATLAAVTTAPHLRMAADHLPAGFRAGVRDDVDGRRIVRVDASGKPNSDGRPGDRSTHSDRRRRSGTRRSGSAGRACRARAGLSFSLWTHCPNSGVGPGMKSARTPLLRVVPRRPPSVVSNVPAAEMATHSRSDRPDRERSSAGSGRRARLPLRLRWMLAQTLDVRPGVAAVVAPEQPGRLGAGVERAVGRETCQIERIFGPSAP